LVEIVKRLNLLEIIIPTSDQSGAGQGNVPPVFLWIWGLQSPCDGVDLAALVAIGIAVFDVEVTTDVAPTATGAEEEEEEEEVFGVGVGFAGASPTSL
jgi:hypothetical protein